jgi:hypothetical protein
MPSSSPPCPLVSRAEVEVNPVDDNLDIRFHHIHMYVDALKPLAEYKKMEGALNQLSSRGRFDPFSGGMKFLDAGALPERIEEGKRIWAEIYPEGAADPEAYSSCNQDVVEQLIVGLGWRVTAEYVGAETRSLLVCSADALGVKFVISAIEQCVDMSAEEPYDHFRRRHIEAYFSAHGNRQGIAVLAFEVGAEGGGVQEVLNKYHEKHPKLNYSGVKRAPWNYHMQRHADSPSNKRPKTVSEAPGAYSYTDTRNVTLSQGGNQQLELGSLQVGEVRSRETVARVARSVMWQWWGVAEHALLGWCAMVCTSASARASEAKRLLKRSAF